MKRLTSRIIGAAIDVHKELGPGLLESTYEQCLMLELKHVGLEAQRQVSVPIRYGEEVIEDAYRIDVLVEDLVILELKAVEQVAKIHKAQLISYLKLAQKPVGLLINFNVTSLHEGISRLYNPTYDGKEVIKL